MNCVVVLRGPSGVGKSTISKAIRRKLAVNWAIIDVDKFKHYMPMKEGQTNRAERTLIAHDVSNYFLSQMYSKGYNVVMEEMYKKQYNDKLVSFMHDNRISYFKVFLSAPVDLVVERAQKREKVVADDEIRRHYGEVERYDDDYEIDSTKYSSEEIADIIISQLKQKILIA